MRLYSRTGAVAVDDGEYGHFDASQDGGFDFPDDLSDRLHKFGSKAGPDWETDIERQQRLIVEEMERRKDPSTLLSAVEQIVAAARTVGTAPAQPEAAPVETAMEPQVPDEEPAQVETLAEPPVLDHESAPVEKAQAAPRKTASARRTPKAE